VPRLIGHGDFAYAPDRCGSSSHVRPIDSDKVQLAQRMNLAALLVDLRSLPMGAKGPVCMFGP
jgi:hypothetical protein